MSEYEPPYKAHKSDKKHRFEQNNYRESNKSHFQPALKADKQKSLDPIKTDKIENANRSNQTIDTEPYLANNDHNRHEEFSDNNSDLYEFDKISQNGLQAKTNHYNNNMASEQSSEHDKIADENFTSDSNEERSSKSDHYQIPFLNQHHAVKDFTSFYDDSSKREHAIEGRDVKRLASDTNELATSANVKSNRMTYQPSFTQTNRYQSRVNEKEADKSLVEAEAFTEEVESSSQEEQSTFIPKQIPTPYHEKESKYQQVDNQLRELAKRLVKTKDSFLLFDH
ncbi:hypothetical protein [Fundicoccus culcitae]|uniref:Uncharacterized protein n=1 Tax=Fundicoccus culcitae TaxID=2969821 RepID=A0ABY5P5Y1_9LACT|nr:hypothetical protein [Fundicoccus culcitae]UUX34162.1 hypothetical protein NRE15_00380 [Fundicoccus culcitae]